MLLGAERMALAISSQEKGTESPLKFRVVYRPERFTVGTDGVGLLNSSLKKFVAMSSFSVSSK